jgi:hypothetical protein
VTRAEQIELDWWRRVFSTRFRRDNLPMPGVPLYAMRLRIVEDRTDREIDQFGRLR